MIEISFLTVELVYTFIWLLARAFVWFRQGQINWKREAVLLSCYYQPCNENFSGFHFASLEHNASSAEWILSTLAAKLR